MSRRGGAAGGRRRFEVGPGPWILLVLAAALPFLPSLGGGFVFDDGGIVRDNPAVHAPGPSAAWTQSYWPGRPETGLYRPWTTFSYWLNERLTGASPAGFHAVNLLLNAAATLLLWRLLRSLFPHRPGPALAAALLFAVHPLHAEAVASIVGRAELWAALWGILAYRLGLEAARRGGALRLAASTAALALAALSKESSAGLLLLPLAHAAAARFGPTELARSWGPGRRWAIASAFWAGALVVVFAARAQVLGSLVGLEQPSLSDNVLAHVPAATRALAALGFQWILLQRTALPLTLSADHSYPQLVPSAAWLWAGAALLLLGAALLLLLARRRDGELLWGFVWILAAGAVTANVLFATGTVLAERLAYLPSAGLLWIGSVAAARAHARLAAGRPFARRALPVLALAWVLFLGARSWARSGDWKDDVRLFRAASEASPRSAKSWSNLAAALLEQDRLEEALAASERAIALYPDFPAARETRGTALTRAGRAEEAVAVLRPALRDPKPRARSLVELGNAWLTLGRGAPAESAFAAAARVAPPSDVHPAIGLASAYALQERWRESEAAWSRAAALDPRSIDVRRSWAYALWKSGAPDRAEALYREVLRDSPEDPATNNDFAWFLRHTVGPTDEALARTRLAFSRRPDEETGDTLLEVLVARSGCGAARAWADSLAAAGAPAPLSAALREGLDRRCGAGAN